MDRIPEWVLRESVDVTLVGSEPGAFTMTYLVVRTSAPGAVTIEFDQEKILVNGVEVDLGDDEELVSSMIDDAAGHMGAGHDRIGVTVHHDVPCPPRWPERS